jgi:acetyl esterase
MAEPTTARPGIDPTMQALLEAFPFKFTADDGVEVARERMRRRWSSNCPGIRRRPAT